MEDFINSLRKRTRNQQEHITQLMAILVSLYDEDAINQESNDVDVRAISLSQICRKHHRVLACQSSLQHMARENFLVGEKESPSTVFHKLSQLLLKWSELELAILKEMGRQSPEDSSNEALLQQEDIEIVRHFLSELDSKEIDKKNDTIG